jgi:hypothetical protein
MTMGDVVHDVKANPLPSLSVESYVETIGAW